MPPEWVMRQQKAAEQLRPPPVYAEPDLWQAMRGPKPHRMPLTERITAGKGDPAFRLPPPTGATPSWRLTIG